MPVPSSVRNTSGPESALFYDVIQVFIDLFGPCQWQGPSLFDAADLSGDLAAQDPNAATGSARWHQSVTG